MREGCNFKFFVPCPIVATSSFSRCAFINCWTLLRMYLSYCKCTNFSTFLSTMKTIILVILIFFALKATALLCVSVKCSCLLCLKSILIRQLSDISWTTFANVTFTMQLNLQVLYLTIRYWHSKDKSFWWFLKIDSTFDSSCHDQHYLSSEN